MTNNKDQNDNSNPECWCGSGVVEQGCCAPLLAGEAQAATAEALMRSRYSAYATGNVDYLVATWYPVTCPAELELDADQRWLGLKVLATQAGGVEDLEGMVEFVARYKVDGRGHRLHEVSHFQKVGARWLYVGGEISSK